MRRATVETNCRATGRVSDGVAGGIAKKTVNRSISKITDKSNCTAAGRATGGATSGIQTDVTIILINSLAYIPRLEN